MAKYKMGDKITYGKARLTVVKGKCENCYFSTPYGCMSVFIEGCASTLGYELICIPVGKGV